MESTFSYPALKIYSQGAQLVVQPSPASGATETLQVDLKSGALSVSKQPGPPQATAIDAMGLLGACKLYKGEAAAIRKACDGPCRRVPGIMHYDRRGICRHLPSRALALCASLPPRAIGNNSFVKTQTNERLPPARR